MWPPCEPSPLVRGTPATGRAVNGPAATVAAVPPPVAFPGSWLVAGVEWVRVVLDTAGIGQAVKGAWQPAARCVGTAPRERRPAVGGAASQVLARAGAAKSGRRGGGGVARWEGCAVARRESREGGAAARRESWRGEGGGGARGWRLVATTPLT